MTFTIYNFIINIKLDIGRKFSFKIKDPNETWIDISITAFVFFY